MWWKSWGMELLRGIYFQHMFLFILLYIYIYRERERERIVLVCFFVTIFLVEYNNFHFSSSLQVIYPT
ncbi:hypothetical protein HanIR_Chr11g0518471 [Helianthus annuus]|nr:hypothetical protein HanIR_Chr11g0518471 [Helianthus annuus]